MENISQKSINQMIFILKKSNPKSYGPTLAKELEDNDIISALYVLNYLKVIDGVRLESQVKDEDTGEKINNFEEFADTIYQAESLGLHDTITSNSRFVGLCNLLKRALSNTISSLSERSINQMVYIINKDSTDFNGLKLSKELMNAEIPYALAVLQYLESVDQLRLDTQMKTHGSYFEDDYEEFHDALSGTDFLSLYTLIDNKKKFVGACTLLVNALARRNLICDFDDAKFPPYKTGRCENPEHLECVTEPVLDMSEQMTIQFERDVRNANGHRIKIQKSEKYIDYFNPSNQKLGLSMDCDSDTNKIINEVASYSCTPCCDYLSENGDGWQVNCDMDAMDV